MQVHPLSPAHSYADRLSRQGRLDPTFLSGRTGCKDLGHAAFVDGLDQPPFGNDSGDQFGRGHVEGRAIADHIRRSGLFSEAATDFVRITLLDRNR